MFSRAIMKFHLLAFSLLWIVTTHGLRADDVVSDVEGVAKNDIRKAGADREEHLMDAFSDPAAKWTRRNLRSSTKSDNADDDGNNQDKKDGGGGGTIDPDKKSSKTDDNDANGNDQVKKDGGGGGTIDPGKQSSKTEENDADGNDQDKKDGGGGGTNGRVLDGSGNPIRIEVCGRFDNEVDGYPCSPLPVIPFRTVFSTTAIFNPPIKESIGQVCRNDGHCAVVYEYDVIGVELELFGGAIDECKGKRTKLLSYGGTVPAKTILVPSGVEAYVQFNNKITREMTPRAKMFNYEGCRPREDGKTGVPISIHNHGQASLAPFDGYAVDRTCLGETKAYMFPNNRPTSGWFHDHAVHQTGLNVLYGMLGFYLISENKALGGCGDPYNLDGVEEIHLALGDYVIDSQCQLYWDEEDAHKNDYYGDINMVNGHPFPTLSNIKRKWYRFRSLNAAVSRPFLLKILTPAGIDISSSLCQVVATDGGWLEFGPVPFPQTGLMIGVAERWEFVCDFGSLQNRFPGVSELILYNDLDKKRMKHVPMFTYSHLLVKLVFDPNPPPAMQAPSFNPALKGNIGHFAPMTVLREAIPEAMARIREKRPHRTFKFGRSGGQWAINGETWDTVRIAARDVGQNSWELWKLQTGGGWVSGWCSYLFYDIVICLVPDTSLLISFSAVSPRSYSSCRFLCHRS
jgi:FtsP/CotA-like multicopper oxidase with cupredoxin domain